MAPANLSCPSVCDRRAKTHGEILDIVPMVVSCDREGGDSGIRSAGIDFDLCEGCCVISVCVIRVNSPTDVRLEV
jgi:hypothetical protein